MQSKGVLRAPRAAVVSGYIEFLIVLHAPTLEKKSISDMVFNLGMLNI